MKKILISIIITVFLFGGKNQCWSQIDSVSDKFNLNFEQINKGAPNGWQANKNSDSFIFSIDSTIVKSGKYSVAIECNNEALDFNSRMPKFGLWGTLISENFNGKQITLSGYIKTENVADGYASLLLHIDPGIGVNEVKISGTTDWKRYEVTIPMDPQKTRNFAIGAMLVGKGKVWFDSLVISIDGKDISQLTPIPTANFNNDSKITIDRLSDTSIKYLTDLGLIWGFLKYYHPSVVKGSYNWDYELFKVVPKILNSNNNIQRDEILVNWIKGLGGFLESNEDTVSNAEIKLRPDLDWINNSGFSNELSTLLTSVKNARRTGENYYVEHKIVGSFEFKNEDSYPNVIYPDAGFRLLSLFRYWNIIQYFYPYKYLIGADWKNVLTEFIPKIIDTKNEAEYTLTVLELIGRIHDTHANIWDGNRILNNYLGKYYAPVKLAFIEEQPVVTGYLDDILGKETGLKIGDILLKVNNIPINEIIKNNLKYTPASNYPTQLRDIARVLLRTNDSIINIEFERNKKTQNKAIKVYADNDLNIFDKFNTNDTCFKMINKDIAYINNGSIKINDVPKIWKEIQHTKGLIIDIRNYPSEDVFPSLCNYLMPKPVDFAKFSVGSISTPGLFVMHFLLGTTVGTENENYYKGKVMILINEKTQSAAEYCAMAYRVHPNAVVVGSTTAGADGNVTSFYLPGGISTKISAIGVYYPDGKETQRIGIIPDIEIKPTIRGIIEGRDELLEKAIEIINK